MSTRPLLLTVALLSMACANPSSALREPVGQTTARATAPPSADTITTTSPDGVEPYPAGQSSGPCGTDPPMVMFDAASTEISAAQLQELKLVVGCLTAGPYETASVVLVGYTDVMGTAAANLQLGLARAQAVMQQLMSSGVAPGRIIVASAGELQRPQARWGVRAPRVEILLVRGGAVRPNEAPLARGIDAEGLLPRPPASPPSGTSTSRTARPTPPANTVRPSTSQRR